MRSNRDTAVKDGLASRGCARIERVHDRVVHPP
jgi:hypothetical protein